MTNYNKDILTFWQTQGLDHIKPETKGEFPEGWDIRDYLVTEIGSNTVIEIGCGYGRLCGKFFPAKYIGVDVNPNAIRKAKQLNKKYKFKQIDPATPLPISDYIFYYTVLLHVPDEDIVEMLRENTRNTDYVIVGEILGRDWRRGGNPPVFNREHSEYIEIFKEAGLSHIQTVYMPYKRYQEDPYYSKNMKDTRVAFMHFETV